MEIAAVLHRARSGVRHQGAWVLARRALARTVRPALAPMAAQRLRRAAAAASSVEELTELAYDYNWCEIRIRPGQVPDEIRGLASVAAARNCRRILEIGTHNGGSLFLLSQVAAPDAHILSIDLPRGAFGGGYARWRGALYRRFGRPGQRIDLIRASSHDTSTLERVRQLLGGEQLDLLFIDGDHTYDGVKHDFELYRGLVRPGGLVALHDIVDGAPSKQAERDGLLGGEVPRFWAELKESYATSELAASEVGFFGIGLVSL